MKKIAHGTKMLIMGTLKKFGKSNMECLYKFLYSNVNGETPIGH
jgi:hypothetical protein